jgi:hypothetical protein
MIDIEFDICVEPDGMRDDPMLDEHELETLLDHTRTQIRRHVLRSLGDLRCEQHDKAPRVRVTGRYSQDSEQLEISYNVDTCCKPFLLRAVQALNRAV